MNGGWLERTALITVKTYPTPSTKHRETVCTAAVTHEDGWIRLYPINYRELPVNQQFSKYQLIQLRMRKHAESKDRRPESYCPDEASIQLLDTFSTVSDKAWNLRRDWLLPTVSPSMCAIQREQEATKKSLGMFRPKEVQDLLILDTDAEWSGKKKAEMSQMRMFYEKTLKLEKIPFDFKYKYRCDDLQCTGHTQMILDWEIVELYRKLRQTHDDLSEIKLKIRKKFLSDLCGKDRDTHFFVGNHSLYPNSFMILGIFWPPRLPPTLF